MTVTMVGPGGTDEAQREAIWELLVEVDHEFVPPLSARNGTTAKQLRSGGMAAAGPRTYFASLLSQTSLLAIDGDQLIGLLSFIAGHQSEMLNGWCPASYVSTVAVRRERRRNRVARYLYDAVLHLPPNLASPYVATRTWSGNEGHLRLLNELGFHEVTHIAGDRGPAVDTVYLARAVDASLPSTALDELRR